MSSAEPAVDDESATDAEAPDDRVERIFADAELPSPRGEASELVGARSGRRVRLEPAADGEQLIISAPNGEVELRVQLTAEGPVLRLTGARVELSADQLALRCRTLDVAVSEAATLETGAMTTKVAGEHSLEVGGHSRQRAHALALESALGNIELHANDDVVVEGERIWLNR